MTDKSSGGEPQRMDGPNGTRVELPTLMELTVTRLQQEIDKLRAQLAAAESALRSAEGGK